MLTQVAALRGLSSARCDAVQARLVNGSDRSVDCAFQRHTRFMLHPAAVYLAQHPVLESLEANLFASVQASR